jgi:antitoxin component YwqK of YwqJK toxin-antitoxin module
MFKEKKMMEVVLKKNFLSWLCIFIVSGNISAQEIQSVTIKDYNDALRVFMGMVKSIQTDTIVSAAGLVSLNISTEFEVIKNYKKAQDAFYTLENRDVKLPGPRFFIGQRWVVFCNANAWDPYALSCPIDFDSTYNESVLELIRLHPRSYPQILEFLDFITASPDHYLMEKDDRGILRAEGYMRSALAESLWKYYDDQGRLQEMLSYQSGLRDSLATEYNVSGLKKSETWYKNALKHGVYTEYDEEGNILIRGLYDHGNKNGPWLYYYYSGKLKEEISYKKDIKHGLHIMYYDNGALASVTQYENGSRVHEKTYFSTGKIKSVTSYQGGDAQGPFMRFYENGNIRIRGRFCKSRYCRTYREYYSNGKPKVRGSYNKEGKKEGVWKEYKDTGGIQKKLLYKNGALQESAP